MNQQLKKGVLEIYVIAFLKRNDSYGYKIVQFLSPLINISESTLYPILRRLTSDGCLTTYDLERAGRLRRYYHVTEYGEQRLKKFEEDLKGIQDLFQTLMQRAYRK